ncbi:futalosine hydrolase [Flavitalea flava]
MHILLAAATTFEIQPAMDFLAGNSSRHEGQDGLQTTVLITGIGSLPATWSLTNQINQNRPDLIIQAGIAGCFTGRKPGELVLIEEEELADLGVWEEKRFKTLFDLRLTDKDAPPFSGGRLLNPYSRLMAFCGLEQVKGITVNEITTDPTRIGWYQQNNRPVVESMEGAALHFVCLKENIPFVQIRAVSNDIGERDKSKWDIPTAIRQLNEKLIRLLKTLDLNDFDPMTLRK